MQSYLADEALHLDMLLEDMQDFWKITQKAAKVTVVQDNRNLLVAVEWKIKQSYQKEIARVWQLFVSC